MKTSLCCVISVPSVQAYLLRLIPVVMSHIDKGWYSMVLHLVAKPTQRMTLALFLGSLNAQKPHIKQLTDIRWFAHSAEGSFRALEELPS